MTTTIDASVVAKAEECFLALLDDELSYADCQAWIAWREERPEHQAAYDKVARLWSALDSLDPKALRSPATAVDGRWSDAARARPAWLPIALAGALLTAIGIGILRYDGAPLDRFGHQSASFETKVAHTGSFQLADGTIARLAGDTRIETDYSGKERRLTLVRGEAFFAVTKDADRPFIVVAGSGEARALGTKFDVNKLAQTVTVSVTEGLVQVAGSAKDSSLAAAKQTTIIGLGERVSYSEQGLRPVEKVALDQVVAWGSGRLVLIKKPLAEVIEEVNRFSSKRILFRPDEIAGMAVSGTVDLSRIDDWLRGLEQGYPLQLLPGGADTLLLTRLVKPADGLVQAKPKK